jgi:hypothetical protein
MDEPVDPHARLRVPLDGTAVSPVLGDVDGPGIVALERVDHQTEPGPVV